MVVFWLDTPSVTYFVICTVLAVYNCINNKCISDIDRKISVRRILRAVPISAVYPLYGRRLTAFTTSILLWYVDSRKWMVGVSLTVMTLTRTLPLSTSSWATTLTTKSNIWRYSRRNVLTVAELSTTNITSARPRQASAQQYGRSHFHRFCWGSLEILSAKGFGFFAFKIISSLNTARHWCDLYENCVHLAVLIHLYLLSSYLTYLITVNCRMSYRLCFHSFCSQWQISTEVHWLSGLRSSKNKKKIRWTWLLLLRSNRMEHSSVRPSWHYWYEYIPKTTKECTFWSCLHWLLLALLDESYSGAKQILRWLIDWLID